MGWREKKNSQYRQLGFVWVGKIKKQMPKTRQEDAKKALADISHAASRHPKAKVNGLLAREWRVVTRKNKAGAAQPAKADPEGRHAAGDPSDTEEEGYVPGVGEACHRCEDGIVIAHDGTGHAWYCCSCKDNLTNGEGEPVKNPRPHPEDCKDCMRGAPDGCGWIY